MAQIDTVITWSPGDSVDATKMNNIIDQATAEDAIITGQTPMGATPVNAANDLVLLYDASAAVPRLRKTTVASLQASIGVTSVGFAQPTLFNLTGTNPIVAAGTFTMSWQQQQNNKVLAAPDDGTLGPPTFRALVPADVDSEISIAALQVNWALGHFFSKTLTANSAFTFANPTAGQTIRVHLIQDASHTATWPAGVRWPGGVNPVMTTGVGRHDLYTFTWIGGTSYLGTFAQNFLV